MATRLLIGVLLAAGALTVSSRVSAHEIGKTQVIADFSAGDAFVIDVTVDPDALLIRLEILTGSPPSTPSAPGELNRRVTALLGVFVEWTRIELDGLRIHPAATFIPAPSEREAAVVRLTGRRPPDAARFVWQSGLMYGSYALSVRTPADTLVRTQWVDGSDASQPVDLARADAARSAADMAWQYFTLGYTHILPKGLDHILFVLGIFFLSPRWRPMLVQVTAFTIAHSITLGVTMLGLASLPSTIVEPLIALSIVYVALENLVATELRSWRVLLVFAFGLLHGMGFAGVLSGLGMPDGGFLLALASFNVGVEAGQVSVLLLASLVAARWRRHSEIRYRRLIAAPASVLIGAVGLYWTVERVWGI